MKKIKGVYTVEATVIISLCFILFGIAVGVTYSIYRETLNYVAMDESDFNAIEWFRRKEMFEDIKDIIEGEE